MTRRSIDRKDVRILVSEPFRTSRAARVLSIKTGRGEYFIESRLYLNLDQPSRSASSFRQRCLAARISSSNEGLHFRSDPKAISALWDATPKPILTCG